MTQPAGPAAPESPEGTPPPGDGGQNPGPPKERFVDGFPEGKPISDMSDAEKALYWENYARKHENTVKSFKGLTPQQIADLQTENDNLKAEKMSASDKALKQARDEAAKSAYDAAKAEFVPQIQLLQVKSIASQIIQGDKLNAFMAVANPAACVGDDGAIDETKVMGYLTAMYGSEPAGPQPPAGQRWQNAGQYTTPPPRGGAADEVARQMKRLGIKPATTT